MGFVSNLFGGGSSKGASNPSGNPYTSQLGTLASEIEPVATNIGNVAGQFPGVQSQYQNLANTEQQYAGSILPTALTQYQAGASGQLTPAMQALSDQALKQANLGTSGTYSNLGLAGSTMEQTDLGANTLQNEAEQANLQATEEQLGLAGLQEGRNWETASGTALGGELTSLSDQANAYAQQAGAYGTEGGILGNAGQQYNTEMQTLMQTLSGLGNKSGGGGLTGALGSGVDSLLNSTGLVSATNQLGLTGGGALTTANLSDLIASGGGVDAGAAAGGAIGGADLLGAGAGTAAAGGGTAADLLGLLAFA